MSVVEIETGRRRVPPRHCDAQQMMHASRPAEYFEDAFLGWLDAAVGGYAALRALGVDLVLAQVTMRYLRPIRLGGEIVSTARIARVGSRSLTMAFALRHGPDVHVESEQVYVCVRDGSSTELPPMLSDAAQGSGPP